MLYSIYPGEWVLAKEEELDLLEMTLGPTTVLFQKKGPFSFQVERMISSNPDDYLLQSLYPGLQIELGAFPGTQ